MIKLLIFLLLVIYLSIINIEYVDLHDYISKQIKVEEGQVIFVEKLDVEVGSDVVFDKVVALSNTTLRIGTPYVKGVSVTCTVEKQGKGKKITIFKYKSKKGSSRRKQGHRQPYTRLLVSKIEV